MSPTNTPHWQETLSPEFVSYAKGEKIDGVEVFHAGTKDNNGEVVANGGRVLSITCREQTLELARKKVYKAISLIDWSDGFYRSDIGYRGLKQNNN